MAEEGAKDLIRVIGICGRLRSGSYTRMAVNMALRALRK